MSTPLARVGAAAAIAAAAMLIVVPSAWSQAAPSISVSPNTGAPSSQFTITLNNYRPCAADNPNCIIITFTQGAATTQLGTADSKGAATFTGTLTVPPGATPGAATIRARSNLDDASTAFTVTAPGTTTAPTSTSTSSSTSSTSTSTSTTSTSSTTTSTIFFPTTTVPVKKKSSSHSDVPRYIAVGLVVLAAAATAAVDSRLRHLRA